MPKYTHMLAEEEELWDKFLATHEKEYLFFEYDIHVGEGTPPPGEYPEEYKKMVSALSTKRIDAIGHTETEIHIFEIRPHAGLPSLGALLGYNSLYAKKFKPTKPVTLNIVTDSVSPDDEKLFAENKIRIFIV